MKRTWLALPSLLALALALSTSAVAQAPAAAPKGGQMGGMGKEDHPHIESAIKALENAKNQLSAAAHDFDGHRSKALEHVNQALEECRAALKSDKK
jgi:Spy/CpxP family protein refolding chaperone